MANVTGGFMYKGSRAAQHDDVSVPFGELIRRVRPAQVLELGTCDGGFTILLRDIMDIYTPEAELLTIDISQDSIQNRKGSRITYREMSFWSGESFMSL